MRSAQVYRPLVSHKDKRPVNIFTRLCGFKPAQLFAGVIGNPCVHRQWQHLHAHEIRIERRLGLHVVHTQCQSAQQKQRPQYRTHALHFRHALIGRNQGQNAQAYARNAQQKPQNIHTHYQFLLLPRLMPQALLHRRDKQ